MQYFLCLTYEIIRHAFDKRGLTRGKFLHGRMAYYRVVVENVGNCYQRSSLTNGRLHFEISSSTKKEDSDPNNNTLSSKNLAAFDLLEEGIRSIKVAPVVREGFNIECIKSTGANEASKSVSVQIIHKRKGTFHDSNDNLALVYVQPVKNLVPERISKLSTFQIQNPNEEQTRTQQVATISEMVITDVDLQNYSRFTFRFLPMGIQVDTNKDDWDCAETETVDEKYSSIKKDDPITDKLNVIDEDETQEDCLKNFDEILETCENTALPLIDTKLSVVSFNTVFDNAISITIEINNLVLLKHSLGSGLLGLPNLSGACRAESRFRNLEEISRNQKGYKQNLIFDTKDPNNNALMSYQQAPNRMLVLRRFIKYMIVHRLQQLGVQQLDCNEIIESWESKQCSTFWYLQWPMEECLAFERSTTSGGIISPLISKPNSSLFRFSPSGHITKSIFSKFVSQVDSLKEIINNATCSLIQISVQLLLPEIKLLWGRQLETNCNTIFIHEWIRLIILASEELKPMAPEEVSVMVNKELKGLKQVARDLRKSSRKLFLKVDKLSQFTEDSFRKTLEQLNPKSLKKLDAFDVALKKKYTPDVIHYDPSQLHKIKLLTTDLFRDHIFISETSNGKLLVKTEIDGFWAKFSDLDFIDRRKIFLAMTEDLNSNLRSCFNTAEQLKEIYTTGYPGSIKNILKDVVQELKFTSKRDDLTLLIKTSIVTHVSCLHEMLTRLLYICQEVDGITKNFKQDLQAASFNVSKLKKQKSRRNNKSIAGYSDTDTMALRGYQKKQITGIEHSNAQLVVPFVNGKVELIYADPSLSDNRKPHES